MDRQLCRCPNFTLAEARHPWILVLDADECIAAQDLPLIKAALHLGPDGYHLIQRNYVFGNQIVGWTPNSGAYPEGKSYPGQLDNPLIRLFRNHPDIRFRGAVHEIVDPRDGQTFGSTRCPSFFITTESQGRRRLFQAALLSRSRKEKIQEDGTNPKRTSTWEFDQELKQHDEAIQCFEKTFEMSRMPVALLYAGISEKLCGRYERALELLQRSRKLGFNSFEVHLELGNVHLALNHQKEALNEYQQCLNMQPRSPVAVFNYGFALRKMGDLAGAQNYYRRALELDSKFKTAALELAIVYATNGRHDEAAALLCDLLARSPEFREARLTLAKTFIQSNQCLKALETLEPTSTEDAVARSLIGAARLQQGSIDEAQSHLEWAIRHDRSLVDARINLSYIYSRKGDFGKAERFRLSATAAQVQIRNVHHEHRNL